MELRRVHVVCDTVLAEGGLPALVPVRRVIASAVIANPLAGTATDDLTILIELGAELGARLSEEALAALAEAPVAYGKGAIVGVAGDVEHGAAIVHPRMGKPIRDAIGGGAALIPSNVKLGAAGAMIDVPLGHRNDAWSFDHIDTVTITVPGAPRPDEIVVVLALSAGTRPRPRIGATGTQPTT
jgi:hypothetical protein